MKPERFTMKTAPYKVAGSLDRLNSCRAGGCCTGFTMLELLVALGVLIFLTALSISMIAQLRSTAATTKSASNLRQMGGALLVHITEYNYRLPLLVAYTGLSEGGSRLDWSHYGKGGNIDGGHRRWYEVLDHFYIQDRSVFLDPSWPEIGWKTRNDGGTANNSTFPYGYNNQLHNALEDDVSSVGAFPETAVSVNELPNYPNVVAIAEPRSPHLRLQAGFKSSLRINDVRNKGNANVLFLDGSVRKIDRLAYDRNGPEPLNFR